jgi:hypothetical protein
VIFQDVSAGLARLWVVWGAACCQENDLVAATRQPPVALDHIENERTLVGKPR